MPAESDIQLFNESQIEVPVDDVLARQVLNLVSEHEHCSFDMVEVVYTTEKGITDINEDHLDRDYVTDIISFRYDEEASNEHIEGTLFCCAPRILEQAAEYDQTPRQEFSRILIHGLLHLVGYEDTSPSDKKIMTEKEDFYLDLLDQDKT